MAVNNPQRPLLLLAQSARLLLQSSRHSVTGRRLAIDAFADEDAQALADQLTCVPWTTLALSDELRRVLQHYPDAAVIYGSGLESCSALLEMPGVATRLLGNPAATLRLCGDPRRWFALLDELRIACPPTRFVPPQSGRWLCKQGASCGGRGVSLLGSTHCSDRSYYQQYLPGQAVSLLFLADGQRTLPLGFNAQWHRADDFTWQGAHNAPRLTPAQQSALLTAAARLTRSLGLRGLNSLDAIADDDGLWVLELNPRPSASMALHESRLAEGLLYWHIRACHGELPMAEALRPATAVTATQVLFATQRLEVPAGWHWPAGCNDLPAAGSRIAAGSPLCTITLQAPSAQAALEQLSRHCGELQQRLALVQAA